MCGSVEDGARVAVAGVVLVRQRPGSAKGVVFMTIEDETGIANAVVWPKTLERFRKVVMTARLILIEGRIQRHEDIIHIVSAKLIDRSDWLLRLSEWAADMKVPFANADEVLHPDPGSAHPSRRRRQAHSSALFTRAEAASPAQHSRHSEVARLPLVWQTQKRRHRARRAMTPFYVVKIALLFARQLRRVAFGQKGSRRITVRADRPLRGKTFTFDDVGQSVRRHDDREIVCQPVAQRSNSDAAAAGLSRHRKRTDKSRRSDQAKFQ